MILKFTLTALFFSVSMTSCRSTQIEIPDNMTAKQLIQQGQNSYESGKYKTAQFYYNTVIERFGDDKATYIEARYEIAHLYIKQKKYNKAQPILEEIIGLFKNAEPGTLPASYEKLAEIELKKIPSNKKESKPTVKKTTQTTQTTTPDKY